VGTACIKHKQATKPRSMPHSIHNHSPHGVHVDRRLMGYSWPRAAIYDVPKKQSAHSRRGALLCVGTTNWCMEVWRVCGGNVSAGSSKATRSKQHATRECTKHPRKLLPQTYVLAASPLWCRQRPWLPPTRAGWPRMLPTGRSANWSSNSKLPGHKVRARGASLHVV